MASDPSFEAFRRNVRGAIDLGKAAGITLTSEELERGYSVIKGGIWAGDPSVINLAAHTLVMQKMINAYDSVRDQISRIVDTEVLAGFPGDTIKKLRGAIVTEVVNGSIDRDTGDEAVIGLFKRGIKEAANEISRLKKLVRPVGLKFPDQNGRGIT